MCSSSILMVYKYTTFSVCYGTLPKVQKTYSFKIIASIYIACIWLNKIANSFVVQFAKHFIFISQGSLQEIHLDSADEAISSYQRNKRIEKK